MVARSPPALVDVEELEMCVLEDDEEEEKLGEGVGCTSFSSLPAVSVMANGVKRNGVGGECLLGSPWVTEGCSDRTCCNVQTREGLETKCNGVHCKRP